MSTHSSPKHRVLAKYPKATCTWESRWGRWAVTGCDPYSKTGNTPHRAWINAANHLKTGLRWRLTPIS